MRKEKAFPHFILIKIPLLQNIEMLNIAIIIIIYYEQNERKKRRGGEESEERNIILDT